MVDFGDVFDEEDDFLWLDDEGVDSAAAYADDLAERVVHSPNWDALDAAFDLNNAGVDWEYFEDEYYDHLGARTTNKSKVNETGNKERSSKGSKSHKASEMNKDKQATSPSDASLPVKFQSSCRAPSPPIANEAHLKAVALLRDWKFRFPLEKAPLKKGKARTSNSSSAEDESINFPDANETLFTDSRSSIPEGQYEESSNSDALPPGVGSTSEDSDVENTLPVEQGSPLSLSNEMDEPPTLRLAATSASMNVRKRKTVDSELGEDVLEPTQRKRVVLPKPRASDVELKTASK